MIFNMSVKKILILVICLMSSKLSAQAFGIELQAETWDVSRHGELLIKIPELTTIINKWSEDPDQKIELRYPGGEEGVLWVEELMDRLVSLGIPSSTIQLLPGSSAEDIIHVVLIEAIKKQ
jgi:hypothetical protein